jgi:hypothetical protein
LVQPKGGNLQRKFTFNRKTGAGVELYRNTNRYITISGLERGTCPVLPSLDALIDTLFDRYSSKTPQSPASQSPSNGEFDFNDASPQDYDDLIRIGAPDGDRSELFHSVVWHLAGQGKTSDSITDELARHPAGIGAKYADRLFEEVVRSYAKWKSHRRRSALGEEAATGEEAGDAWPEIYVVAGELPRVVAEAEKALILSGREVFQRGSQIVRPVLQRLKASDDRETRGWQLVAVTGPDAVVILTCSARFWKYDARKKGWVAVDAPTKVAEAWLAGTGRWKLPLLTGVASAPFLRADGSVWETPGYDAATGLLYKPECVFPPVPARPTRDDAVAALTLIEDLLSGFPFVAPADRSVGLSAILTPLDRRSMPSAPLHGFTAPAAGTGKSKLVDIASALATGRIAPVTAQGATEEEIEKRLAARFLTGDPVISIDNCEHPLQSAFLCQALTQGMVSIRLLGHSRTVETPTVSAIYATGNNLQIAGDLTRRTLLCALDARCEHPERRVFARDPVDTARANRGRLVVAGLTILKAWRIAGEEGTQPLGSFETWSYRVRDALIWLDRADPCETLLTVKAQDPKVLTHAAIMTQWREYIGLGCELKIQEIINRSLNARELHTALMNVAVARNGIVLSPDRLGRWLNQVNGKIVGGTFIEKTRILEGYPLWRLRCVP